MGVAEVAEWDKMVTWGWVVGWVGGMLGCWNVGVLECWGVGMLGCGNGGVLECWGVGVMFCGCLCLCASVVKKGGNREWRAKK